MRRTRSVPAFVCSTLEGPDDWDMLDLMPMNEREEAVQAHMARLLAKGKWRGDQERTVLRNAYYELVRLVSGKGRAKTLD